MLVDSHCHLDRKEFANDFHEVIDQAIISDVKIMLTVSVEFDNFTKIISMLDMRQELCGSLGIHPLEVNKYYYGQNILDKIRELSKNQRIIAIGETGLDFYKKDFTDSEKNTQKEAFIAHLKLGSELGLPVIVHSRGADDDTLNIMNQVKKSYPFSAVMHCFSGTREFAEKCLHDGYYISYSGIVTFKNAAQVKESALITPSDRLLVETDSPYLAPEPFRGKRCEPKYVVHTANKLADIRSTNLLEIANSTTINFFRLFSKAHNAFSIT